MNKEYLKEIAMSLNKLKINNKEEYKLVYDIIKHLGSKK